MTAAETSRFAAKGAWKLALQKLFRDSRFAFVASLTVGALIWQLLATTILSPDTISTPILILTETYALFQEGVLVPNVLLTLKRTFYAMIVTMVVGTVLGVLVGWNDFWQYMLQDYILVGLGLPTLLAAVFAAIIFGPNPATPTLAGTLLAFPFLAQNVKNAIEDIDAELIEMSSSFDVSRRRVFWRVIVMSILPEWFSGMRNAYTVTWKIVTVAEFVSFTNGVGFYIGESIGLFSMEAVLAWTFSFSIIIIAIEYAVFQTVENYVFDWREEVSLGTAVA